jgi:hypothetical protein
MKEVVSTDSSLQETTFTFKTRVKLQPVHNEWNELKILRKQKLLNFGFSTVQ